MHPTNLQMGGCSIEHVCWPEKYPELLLPWNILNPTEEEIVVIWTSAKIP